MPVSDRLRSKSRTDGDAPGRAVTVIGWPILLLSPSQAPALRERSTKQPLPRREITGLWGATQQLEQRGLTVGAGLRLVVGPERAAAEQHLLLRLDDRPARLHELGIERRVLAGALGDVP